MYAVIKTGGKQYRVAAEDKIQIEKLPGEAGDIVEFTDVLMVASDGSVDVGAPFVSGATVAAEIIGQVRGPKVIIFKKHRRKHFRRKNGHRQDLTSVKITEILTGGAKPSKKAAAKPAKAEKTAEAAPLAAPIASEKKADDLALIGGVGPKILKTLNDMGYTTYAQIANLSPAEIEKIEAEIKMPGRIAREEWAEQATELAAGKPPRAKVDKEAKAEKAKTPKKSKE
ncbi:50S ribosomal protein L21 [Taklimakanibacter lacteus]|uniref:50S ribosomal protein L21 n=1 Tax=Taklimakanibacter lacteus TaxID=2268456 RepID=UPI000E66E213